MSKYKGKKITDYPSLLEEWDYEKNVIKPEDIQSGMSTTKFWWKCKLGHSFLKSIDLRINRHSNCPVCANKRIENGYNDLATTHPHLIKEWDFSKNLNMTPQQVTYGSEKKVWWLCKKGHSWSASINSRVNGRGCPKCVAESLSSLTEKAFAYYLIKAFPDGKQNIHLKELNKKELDVYIPSLKLGVEYDGHIYHKDPKRDLDKDLLCEKNGISLIRIREEGCAIYNSPAYFIKCSKNHGNILELTSVINEILSYINGIYHLNIELINSIEEDLVEINKMHYTQEKLNSISNKCPKLLDEWCYDKNGSLNPEMISAGSDSKVWWKCEKGHIWLATVSSRVRGNGCPYCNNKYVLTGFNDLKSKCPKLMQEWDYDKNKDFDPNNIYYQSNQEAWWKCNNGHSWKTRISTRTKLLSDCPVCYGLLPEKGVNDLETLYPDLAKEWDFDKNKDIKPSDFLSGSEKKVWWKCPKGHSYKTQIAIRAKMNCGCPVCSNKVVLSGFNDLETLHPDLAKEWNYKKNGELLPSQVGGAGGSHLKVWWVCPQGHEWQAKLSHRISSHSSCPVCYRISRKNKTK